MLLDKFIPQYQFNEVHSVRLSAPPERALESVKRVTPGEMPLVRLLFTVWYLPALLTGRQRAGSLLYFRELPFHALG
jgi:hypothetical protein